MQKVSGYSLFHVFADRLSNGQRDLTKALPEVPKHANARSCSWQSFVQVEGSPS